MKHITNFTKFGEPQKEIYAYLTNNLLLGSTIDTEIVDIVTKNKNKQEHLPLLLDLCIKLCHPYVYHSVLLSFNFVQTYNATNEGFIKLNRLIGPDNKKSLTSSEFSLGNSVDFSSLYYTFLKEHIAISFYYSWQLCEKGSISLYKSIKYNFPSNTSTADIEPIDPSIYKCLKNKQASHFSKQLHDKYSPLLTFISDSINGSGKFHPKLIDNPLILALTGQQLSNPYAKKFQSKPYSYENLSKLVHSFTDISFDDITGRNDNQDFLPASKIVSNNYATERLLHFDFISFLISKYNELEEINTINYNKFLVLGELASLPNVFSRISMADVILKSYPPHSDIESTNKNRFHSWAENTRFLVKFLTKCTFPIINLTFKYIMEYYLVAMNSEHSHSNTHNLFHSIFENYLKELIDRKDTINLYTKIKNPNYTTELNKYKLKKEKYDQLMNSDRHVEKYSTDKSNSQKPQQPKKIKPYIIASKNSLINGKNITDHNNLCNPLSKRIFFEIMTEETFATTEIDYINPFTETKVQQLQNDRLNYLIDKIPLPEPSPSDLLANMVK